MTPVVGSRATYPCPDVAAVDAHLTHLVDLLTRPVPTYHPGRPTAGQLRYRRDIDTLLTARLMLAVPLDDDLRHRDGGRP